MYNRLKSIGKQLLAVAKQDWRRLKRIWKALPIRNQLIVRIAFYPVILISLLYLTISILGFFKIGEVSAWLGTFGDFVGGITNPVFSFLAFLGLLWTIKQQRDELGISREELRLTREELAKSADAQELHAQTAIEQQKLIQLQQFESTFFSLLANHELALKKITDDSSEKGSTVERALENFNSSNVTNQKELFNFFSYSDITSYFIVLYQLLKFIDGTNFIDHGERKKYTSLLRSYLNNNVLILIMYNCYVDGLRQNVKTNSFVEYKSLVEKYSILEHVSWDLTSFCHNERRNVVINKKNLNSDNNLVLLMSCYRYENSAFGNNVHLAIENLKNCMGYFYFRYVKSSKLYHDLIELSKPHHDNYNSHYKEIDFIDRAMRIKNILHDKIDLIEKNKGEKFAFIDKDTMEDVNYEIENNKILSDFKMDIIFKYEKHGVVTYLSPECHDDVCNFFSKIETEIDNKLEHCPDYNALAREEEKIIEVLKNEYANKLLSDIRCIDNDYGLDEESIYYHAVKYHINQTDSESLLSSIKRALDN